MQATDKQDVNCKTLHINTEAVMDTAQRIYNDMSRIVDPICQAQITDNNLHAYLAKFAAVDGLCNVIDQMHSAYCEIFEVSVCDCDEVIDSDSTPEEVLCAKFYGLYGRVYEERQDMKCNAEHRRTWANIIRSVGVYIANTPEVVDEASDDDLPPY